MCGTDFSMLQVFFPGRTRQQLKKKFFRYYVLVVGSAITYNFIYICREEKEHPELVKCALDSKLPLGKITAELNYFSL